MRIAILTGGGDAPGLNTAVYEFTKLAEKKHEVYLALHGWRGMLEGELVRAKSIDLLGSAFAGGTFIKTSRTNPFKDEERAKRLADTIKSRGIDVIIAIGGDDTLGAAAEAQSRGLANVVGIPKTIDNDLPETDYTLGFDTAVNIATTETEYVKTSSVSHERISVVEVMGREAGWIALFTGLATGADAILIPEKPIETATVVEKLKRAYGEKKYALAVVSEGVKQDVGGPVDEYGHARLGGVGNELAAIIEKELGVETRATVLGHTIRGSPPSAFDRVLATRFAASAFDAMEAGEFGVMVALKGNDIAAVRLSDIAHRNKLVSGKWLELLDRHWSL
ncbi:pyrophosphate--fructose 6-phosphate 1-phosphotransferase [Thermocladium modestius]|uniref:Pyrophosphate--fructose 6-phosphate 1-phosphotransferase n=1 Tax=Thermocladium modestius TaxID=62609 RepID=A0A830GVR9_9CREN|nr:ATP-dependent 6-phosphofructokinase [Thermocladium modestius]GGP22240.1 pyrophosphate--fructose 6-phosphate 1-phosphotransferase [Thermocladium modestius]